MLLSLKWTNPAFSVRSSKRSSLSQGIIVGQSDLGENLAWVFPRSSCLLQGYARYFFERFSLRFFLFSSLSFLVIGFFFELFPIPNSITTLK